MYNEKKSATSLAPTPTALTDVHHNHTHHTLAQLHAYNAAHNQHAGHAPQSHPLPHPHPHAHHHLSLQHTHHIHANEHALHQTLQHQMQQFQHQQQQQQPTHQTVTSQQHMTQVQQQQQPQNQQLQLQQQQQQQEQYIQQQQQQLPEENVAQQQQSQQSSLFTRFDANKSTKGASKLRRDLINTEIANLRDLLPLPQSTRQRLSQLQLMALVCVYVRKANYFQQVFKRHELTMHQTPTPNIGFSKALSGFLMMLTQNGKLLYISDNAAEYLGHSMEDLLIHGDSVYDIIDKQDHSAIQAELNRNIPPQPGQHANSAAAAAAAISSLEGEHRMFLCRMNVSRNARRQMRFGDQKVVLVQGHYLSFLPLCSRNEPVFLATCTPIAMPETRECVVQGATNVFTTIHSMDMKLAHIDKNGEFHLGYNKNDIQGVSWYNLLHTDNLREAQSKHRLITQSEQDRSCILLVRMQRRQGDFIWVHVVLQVRDSQDTNQPPVIVCTNQVLNEREASVMIANSWLYHYYTVQSKLQFGLPFEGSTRVPPTTPGAAAAAAAAYYHHHHHNHHHHHHSPTGVGTPAAYAMAMHNPHGHQYHPHHMTAYGTVYHSNTTEESNQQSNGNTHNGHGVSVYGQRLGLEPVDYSPLSNTGSPPTSRSALSVSEMRCSSANSSVSSQHTIASNYQPQTQKHKAHSLSSPTAKRRALGNLEPLFIPEEDSLAAEDCTSRVETMRSSNNHYQTGRGSVVFATVVPTRPRFLAKTAPQEPPDFMDQWNPSPPWSDTAQKTSSIDSSSSASHQELSPCITTTPPTPTSAQPQNNGHYGVANCNTQALPPAFTFEWMSDQLVPPTQTDSVVPCLTTDGVTLMVAHHNHTHWANGVSSENAHQQLSQHLAAHGHRIFGQVAHEPQFSHELELRPPIKLITKTEVVEEIDEKPKM